MKGALFGKYRVWQDVRFLASARPQMSLKIMGTSVSFQFRNEQFCARSRKSRDCAEAYKLYVAQAIPKIDTEIAEKGHFWMETSYGCPPQDLGRVPPIICH
jgi:hypothetical protein